LLLKLSLFISFSLDQVITKVMMLDNFSINITIFKI